MTSDGHVRTLVVCANSTEPQPRSSMRRPSRSSTSSPTSTAAGVEHGDRTCRRGARITELRLGVGRGHKAFRASAMEQPLASRGHQPRHPSVRIPVHSDDGNASYVQWTWQIVAVDGGAQVTVMWDGASDDVLATTFCSHRCFAVRNSARKYPRRSTPSTSTSHEGASSNAKRLTHIRLDPQRDGSGRGVHRAPRRHHRQLRHHQGRTPTSRHCSSACPTTSASAATGATCSPAR